MCTYDEFPPPLLVYSLASIYRVRRGEIDQATSKIREGSDIAIQSTNYSLYVQFYCISPFVTFPNFRPVFFLEVSPTVPCFQLPNNNSKIIKKRIIFFLFLFIYSFSVGLWRNKKIGTYHSWAVQLCDAWCADATQQTTQNRRRRRRLPFVSIFRWSPSLDEWGLLSWLCDSASDRVSIAERTATADFFV